MKSFMFSNVLRTFIKDEKEIPTGVKLIVFVIFLRTLGWGFVDPFIPMYFREFNNNYALIGLFISLMPVGALLAIIPLMRLADKIKDTVLIRDGEVVYFFTILLFVLAGLSKNVILVIAAQLLCGVGHSLMIVGTESYIRKHNLLGQSKPFGLYMALDYGGWVLGMVIGAFTIQYYGFSWMFLAILPSILAGLLILPIIHEEGIGSLFFGIKKYFHKRQDFIDIFEDIRELSPKMFFFLFLAFFDGVILMFFVAFIPLLGLSINLSLKHIALLMAVTYLPFVFSFFFSEITDRFCRMNVITAGLFVGAMSYFLLYFIVDQMWVVALIAMTSFSMAIIRPVYNGTITRLSPRRMLGEVTGFNNFFNRLGRIFGPILTGVIASIYGIQTCFLVVAISAFVFGIVSVTLHGYNHLAVQAD